MNCHSFSRITFIILFFGIIHQLSAGECSVIFRHNSKDILATKSYTVGGYVFAVGRTTSKLRKDIGFRKAQLIAYNHLKYDLGNRIKWPAKFSNEFRTEVINEYFKCQPFEIILSHFEIVYKEKKGNVYTLVLGVPQEKMSMAIPSFEVLRATLLSKENYASDKVKVSICLEFCDGIIPEDLLVAYAVKLGAEYGENIRNLVLGKNAYSFKEKKTVDFNQLSIDQLLKLLNESPYDPELCFVIANKMSKKGLSVSAKIFYARGAIAVGYCPEYAEKCSQKIGNYEVKELHRIPDFLLSPCFDKTSFMNPALVFLEKNAGKLPIGSLELPNDESFTKGKQAFARGNLEEAYQSFQESIATKITFSGCNMAGNTGRRIGYAYESIVFLIQAIVIDPSSVYPWIHLTWIYRSLDLKDQAKYCLEKISSYQLDTWSSQQVDMLRSN